MDLDFSEEVFSLRDPWRFPLIPQAASLGSLILDAPDFDLKFSYDNPYAPQEITQEELKVPEPEEFQYGALEDIPALDESLATTDDGKGEESVEALPEELAHIWDLVVEDPPIASDIRLYSWEAFQEPKKEESSSPYLSEAGNAALNLALYLQRNGPELLGEVSVIRNDVFLHSLFALGLGRSSALFRFDPKRRQFDQVDNENNVSGLSKESVQSLVDHMTKCGQLIRYLRDFVDRTYASGKAYPARVALANSVGAVIDALELRLTVESRKIISLLQLQKIFERPYRILVEIHDLAKAVRNARSNEELASLVFKRCQHCDQEPDWLRSTMLQILARVSQPWLELVEKWIGFKTETGVQIDKQEGTFIATEPMSTQKSAEEAEVPQELQYNFRPDKLPMFISLEDGQTMFDIGRDIRILRTHHSNHPLARPEGTMSNDISLRWQFDWQDVNRVAARAKAFEASLTDTIRKYRGKHKSCQEEQISNVDEPQSLSTPNCFDPFKFQGDDMFQDPTPYNTHLRNELFEIITANLSSEESNSISTLVDFSPPISITPVLSFNPLLAVQQRMLNAVMIRLFFRSHNLRLHLSLQRSFHLLGDGVFVSRLSAALFDPDQSSTERQRGVMRSGSGMGLRLGSRGTWPPASSELRLALMGILSDCYHAAFSQHTSRTLVSQDHDLPGSLSFAIRQLSEEEAEQILDADSLHALDFLRLQYTSPSPLGAVLTPTSLDRYDTIFKFLLRLTRLLFVVSHLPRDIASPPARLFRWQAENFVTTCSRYFFETGVKETWSVFMQYLDSIERRLKEEDEASELGTRVHEGIEDMRKQHDLCLERITFALLLRNRQQKVMKVLEDILTTILEFSKMCHTTENLTTLDADDVSKLHVLFNDNMKLFLEVCRGLVGKKGYGKLSGDTRGGFGGRNASGEENTIERLVVALDHNGFYERRG